MSKYRDPHRSPESRRHSWHGPRDPFDVTPVEIIVTGVVMVILVVVLFGAISQARASAARNNPTEVAAADLKFAAQQVQLQKFLPCSPTNPEPYSLSSSAITPTASSDNLAIATNSLPIAQAPSAGIYHPYSAQLRAINGVSDFAWSVSPHLPPGLSLSPEGLISGVPQAEGSAKYTFTLVSNGDSDSKALSLTIVSVKVLVPDALLKWTPCQRESESTISKISSTVSNVTSGYSAPTPFVRGEEDSISGAVSPSPNVKSFAVVQQASNHSAVSKRMVDSYRSTGSVKRAKSPSVELVKLSTRVQERQLTREIQVTK